MRAAWMARASKSVALARRRRQVSMMLANKVSRQVFNLNPRKVLRPRKISQNIASGL